jgi:hypothetical protein
MIWHKKWSCRFILIFLFLFRHPDVPGGDRDPLLGQVLHGEPERCVGRHRPPHSNHDHLYRVRGPLLPETGLAQVGEVGIHTLLYKTWSVIVFALPKLLVRNADF